MKNNMLHEKLNYVISMTNPKAHALIMCFENIDESVIDDSMDLIEETKNFISLNFYRKLNKSYPIHLGLGMNPKKFDRFDLWFGYKDNPLIEMDYEDINDGGLVTFAESYISTFLRSNLVETKKVRNNSVVSITVKSMASNKVKVPIDIGMNQLRWFWLKTEMVKKSYEPWISD